VDRGHYVPTIGQHAAMPPAVGGEYGAEEQDSKPSEERRHKQLATPKKRKRERVM